MTSASKLSNGAKGLLRQLRDNHRWLTEQHRLWIADDPQCANDRTFAHRMALFSLIEQALRCAGLTGCIWAPGGRCPQDAPVTCDRCTESDRPEQEVQLGTNDATSNIEARPLQPQSGEWSRPATTESSGLYVAPRPEPFPNFELTPDMAEVLDRLGHTNALVTGAGGTGKSTLLTQYHATTDHQVAVTAPTGIAALNAGGMTIHKFFGFHKDIRPEEAATKSPRNPDLYRNLGSLIIDEASMLRADLLDCVEVSLRKNGPKPGHPFGGVAVGLFGDPYQLPPVVTNGEAAFMARYPSPHFFASEAYRTGGFTTTSLVKPFRQSNDDFLRVLGAVRDGSAAAADLELFNERVQPEISAVQMRESDSTMLTTHNAQASTTNRTILDSLPGTPSVFRATISGDFPPNRYPTDTNLALKPRAKVMLITNNMPHWVNGTTAVVAEIEPEVGVWVTLPDGRNAFVSHYTWDQVDYQVLNGRIVPVPVGEFQQLPLRLAWAVTIHKAQGLTLDRGIVNLERRVFAPGQLYVALSRFRTLDGLTITPRAISKADIRVDEAVRRFMEALHEPAI